MQTEEIQVVACLLEKYASLLNCPTQKNKIEIIDGMIRIIQDGIVLFERPINTKDLNLKSIEYKYNPFRSQDLKYSPFEADRTRNFQYWKQSYTKINFPAFVPVPLISWLALGKIPDVVDFCRIYLLAYTENVPQNSCLDRRQFYSDNVDVYSNVGQILKYTDGQTIPNNLIRFKPRYTRYLHGFPCNQFTTEQVCNRIYKIYGSCLRDPYNMLRMNELGAKTVYDTYLDIVEGMDGIIEDVPYYGYSKTKASIDFRKIKVTERHKSLKIDKGIVLLKKNQNSGGVYIMDDNVFLTVIERIKENKINGIETFQG